jgi:cobalamin biosynthesis protein CbiG
MSGFTKDWALNWVEGFVVSYFFGGTSLEEVLGVIKRAIESYGIKPREIGAIISIKTLDPALNISRKTREERARPLIEFIENLEKGEKRG